MSEPELEQPDLAALLCHGTIEIRGRILPASNAAFLAQAVLGDAAVRCIVKPVAGERPLWDFPDGTLAAREVAAYLVSEALGWHVVPLTVLRDTDHGPAMAQQWCDPDEDLEGLEPVDLCRQGRIPSGFLHVLDASDAEGHQVSLVHEDSVPMRRMAVFDCVINNADRKGGHVLPMPDGHRYGVDHGVSFHVENKLRTVLWGWAGESLLDDERTALARLIHQLQHGEALRRRLEDLLTGAELTALEGRATRLLRADRLPRPGVGWPSIPWPAL